MHPVLFTIGSFPVSSFGVSLALAFLAAVFITWRLARVYDVNEEKILDLSILTFFGSLIGARIFFTVFHWNLLGSLERVLLINRYPGLSFWGGLLGGCLTLWFFGRRNKFGFWQLADFGAVGLMMGLVFGDLGCLLGGCSVGVVSNSFLALPVTGLLGKRFPISGFESLILLLVFVLLWKQVVRFHFDGKIAAFTFIWLGMIKFFTEFFRGDSQRFISSFWLTFGHLYSLVLFVVGVAVFYRLSKHNFVADLQEAMKLFSSPKKRQLMVLQIRKSWYNHLAYFRVRKEEVLKHIHSLPKTLKKRLNVKSTPPNFS